MKAIDIAREFRIILLPTFGIADETGELRKMFLPAKFVVLIAHYDFGSDIVLEFVDLFLFCDSFLVGVRVREKTVDTEVFNWVSL